MNFFKSVFADDPDDPPSNPETTPDTDTETQSPNSSSSTPTSPNEPTDDVIGSRWNFGSIMKTISTRSESVLETYKRDLQEFSAGLKSETDVLKHVATSSLDIGAAKASVSLESVGQAIDSFGSVVWKSTAEIISHGKESLLAHDLDAADSTDSNTTNLNNNNSLNNSGAKYSRFEAQLRGIQSDEKTYIEEPEEREYEEWKGGFEMGEFREEVDGLMMSENGSVVGEVYRKVVPSVVESEVFWCRYFYRVHRLKQAEFVRAKLVKRAIETDDEEELSWDVDDDVVEEDGEASGLARKVESVSLDKEKAKDEKDGSVESEEQVISDSASFEKKKQVVRSEGASSEEKGEGRGDDDDEEKKGEVKSDHSDEKKVSEKEVKNEIEEVEEKAEVKKVEEKAKGKEVEEKGEVRVEEKVELKEVEGKGEPSESSKDSDISVVSSQPSHEEEEDLGWDEIEDIGSGDEKKPSQLGSPNRAELRKRLSAAEDDEDLSWDIEDDDEPIKS